MWAARYDGPTGEADAAYATAVSPDGTKVYVTGYSRQGTSYFDDYATVAYDAATGSQIWVQRFDGPGSTYDHAQAIDVSPDGAMVFVTGYSEGVHSHSDYATIAYDAASGDQIWIRRYADPQGGYDDAYSIVVGPDGTMVFVTGSSWGGGGGSNYDYATVAYDAVTGDQVWVERFDGAGKDLDNAYSVDVSPDGTRVYVTGTSYSGTESYTDYATVSYNAATGAEMWVKKYDGPGAYEDIAYAVRASPDGSKVFVTGQSYAYPNDDYATIAYDASTGAEVWQQRYDGLANAYDEAYALAVSPDGSRVVVTGASEGVGAENDDYETVVYDAATGSGMWQRRYNGPGNVDDVARAVVVSPDGTEVYVTGQADGGYLHGYPNYATIGYNLATGTTLWAKSINGKANASDSANDIGVSPDGSAVFVTGSTVDNSSDFTTVAYATS